MRMKEKFVSRLHELIATPHLSLRSQLILMRRMARHLTNVRSEARDKFAPEVELANAALPFTKGELAKMKQRRVKVAQGFRLELAAIGAWITQQDVFVTAQYEFHSICDLLGVNSVHRASVSGHLGDGSRTISAIVLGAGLEDSAASLSGRHPAELKDGALYQALWEEMKNTYAYGRDAQIKSVRTNMQA